MAVNVNKVRTDGQLIDAQVNTVYFSIKMILSCCRIFLFGFICVSRLPRRSSWLSFAFRHFPTSFSSRIIRHSTHVVEQWSFFCQMVFVTVHSRCTRLLTSCLLLKTDTVDAVPAVMLLGYIIIGLQYYHIAFINILYWWYGHGCSKRVWFLG